MKIAQLFKRVSEALSICIFLGGSVVLIGWILDIPVLKSISPDFVTMKANAAICFIFIGLSLWLLQTKRQGNRTVRKIARLFAFAVFLIGFLTFLECVLERDFGIDQLLFKESATAILTSSPGRMAFNTSIIFGIIGIALFMTGSETALFSYLAQLLVIPAGILALLSFVGYVYGASPLYIGAKFSTAMAVHTCVLFLMSCIGCLFARPEQGLMKDISSDNYGGLMLRRILPVVIVIPLVLGWFKIYGVKAGWFGHEFGISFLATFNLAAFSLFVYILSVRLNRLDVKRKLTETVLQTEKNNLEAVFEASPIGMLLLNEKYEVTKINGVIEKLVGQYRLGDQPGNLFRCIHSLEDPKGCGHSLFCPKCPIRNAIKTTLDHGHSARCAEVLSTFLIDGKKTDIWLEVNTEPVVLDGKKCVIVAIDDITTRKLTETALKESEAKYKTLFSTAVEGILVADVQKKQFLYCNPAICRMLGYAEEELMHLGVGDIHPKEALDHVLAEFEAQVRGEKKSVEVPCLRKDGTVFDASIGTSGIAIDGRECILGFFTDITDRKKAEEKISTSQALLQRIINLLPVRVFWKDKNLRYLGCNEIFAKDAGKNASEDLIGKDDFQMIWKEQAKSYRDDDQNVINSGKPKLDFEELQTTPKGDKIWLKTSKVPLIDLQGNAIGILGTYEDITERKRMEEAMENRIVALTQPLDDVSSITFEDLFNVADIQRLQDEFSSATGVASIITHIDGTPITAPSNFCRLCKDVIRKTDKGLANCFKSDAAIGRYDPSGPVVQPCLSGGLWDAGAGINVGGRHIANWLIGQVRDESQTEEKMREYARQIGADEQTVVEAFREVPAMSQEQFGRIAQSLFTLANQLSTMAYQNVQQARFIAERKQAEDSYRRQSALLENVINSSPDFIFVKDIKLRSILCNEAYAAAIGKKSAELIGHTDIENGWDPELVRGNPEKGIRGFENDDRDALSGKTIHNPNDPANTPDGVRIFDTYKIPLYGENKEIIGLLGVSRDITEQKQTEELLKQAKTQAEVANEAKSRFLANISHEMRTPLNAIIGFSKILMQEELAEEQKEQIKMVYNSGGHLLGLINDILNISSIEAGKMNIEMKQCPLEQLIANIESMMQPFAAEKGLTFEIREKGDLPTNIVTDAARLQQCLTNLVNNAIKFTKQGHVYVNISLKDKDSKPCIRFEVEDTGIGIATESQQKIFEPFFQEDGGTSRKYGGTGLGLTIARKFAGLLGGEITLTSEKGKGSVFSLIIPAGVDLVAEPILKRHKVIDDASKVKGNRFFGCILVAEDVKTNQMLMKLLLEKMGLKVTIAEDGAEAVDKALGQKFDLIFMDIQMPKVNGYEATRTLRDKGIKIPIVALTAGTMEGDEKKCIEAGCDVYLSKPVVFSKLIETLSKYLPSENQVLIEAGSSAS
jgi:PAS domain S-box-containing protein